MKKRSSFKRRYYKFLIWIKSADNHVFIFLFFLAISGALWFLNALSKNYVTEIETPIDFVGIPRELKCNHALPEILTSQVSGRGFALLRYKIATPSISYKYDIKPYFIGYKKGEEVSVQIITQLAQKQIEQYYGGSLTLLDIYPRTINATFSKIVYKKVAVTFNGELSFEPQFWQKGNIKIIPDSIEIGGPENVMDTINEIRTLPIKIEKIRKHTDFTVALDNKNIFNIEQPDIQISLDVEKFTETTIKIPIKVINAPEKFNIMLFPDQITVKYRIAIDEYEHIAPNSFTAIVDYNQMNAKSKNEKIKVDLVEYPENIKNITIHPREVKYLIGEKR